MDWNYTTEDDGHAAQCHKNYREDLLLGRMLGGTSSLNYLMFSQGHYRDYNNWASIVGDDIWNWSGVRPYFVKATNLHNASVFETPSKHGYGDKGPVGLTIDSHKDFDEIYLKAFEEAGHKIVQESNAIETMGYARAMYTIGDGLRQSSAYCYLRPSKDFSNLHVLKRTEAKKILFDDNNNAIGVEVVTEDGTTITVKSSKEVIISGGAIHSPKLLMLSGIGPKKHLESKEIEVIADLPVGQNFHDHVATILIHNMTKLENTNVVRDPREYPAGSFVGYANLDKTKDYPTYSTINWVNYAPFLVQFCTWTYGLQDEICDAMFEQNTNQMVWTLLTNLNPKSRGEVLLRSADYTDPPIVWTGHFSKKEDLENQVKYIKDFVRVAKTSSFNEGGGELVNPKLSCCKEYRFGSTDYWRCYAECMMNSKRNYCGTNAMGSVVDSRLRVKGVNRLRVADASIIPIIPRGDIHGSVVVIGEKAADIIKEDHNMEY